MSSAGHGGFLPPVLFVGYQRGLANMTAACPHRPDTYGPMSMCVSSQPGTTYPEGRFFTPLASGRRSIGPPAGMMPYVETDCRIGATRAPISDGEAAHDLCQPLAASAHTMTAQHDEHGTEDGSRVSRGLVGFQARQGRQMPSARAARAVLGGGPNFDIPRPMSSEGLCDSV